MSEEPKSIWKRPWKGPAKVLAWFGLLAGAVFLTVCCLGLISDQNSSVSELVAYALIVSVVIGVLGVAIVLFVRWLCCWRNFCRFLFGVACFVTLIALIYAEEDWRGKYVWKKFKTEWEAKGEKFTLAALAPPPVPDDQNFALAPLLKPVYNFTNGTNGIHWLDTNGLSRLQNLRADIRPDRSRNDTLPLGSLEKETFADLEACRDFYRRNTNYPQPVKPGTAAEDILVALGKFDPEIAELREAAASRPDSRFPIRYDEEPPWGILLPHLADMKGLCTVMQMRAIAELEMGRAPEAFADLKLGFRLSDSIRNEPLLIDHLVRIATLTIDLQTVREGLVRHAWSDAQLAELEDYLASLNLLAEYKLAVRGERACNTSGLDWLRRRGFRTDIMNYIGAEGGMQTAPNLGFNPFPSGWFYQNMLTISRMHQEFTLAAVDEKARRVFPDVSEKLDSTLKNMPTRPYTFFAKLLMPALSKAASRSARTQTSVDEARVACALERYRFANEKLPDTLAALSPRFIGRIPDDVIDGKPLRYRVKSDGSYIIYSVGWNKTDDGGELAWTKGSKLDKSRVDITKGDWVWLMPPKAFTAAELSLLH